MKNPPIVILAYNRPKSLQRLLKSLTMAEVPEDTQLIFSIEGGAPVEIVKLANDFKWSGEKMIVIHPKKLGLPKHMEFFFSLFENYSHIIRLEDDLFVSPTFYSFAKSIIEQYAKTGKHNLVSLYSYNKHSFCSFPFSALTFNNDYYLLQKTPTWGEVWNRKLVQEFLNWKKINGGKSTLKEKLPTRIFSWGMDDWELNFNMFLVQNNQFVLYPSLSYTTNFNDLGLHVKRVNDENLFQSMLQIVEKPLQFEGKFISLAKYDIFFEPLPEFIKSLNPNLNDFDFDVDLYGLKGNHHFTKPYILGSRVPKNIIKSYGRNLKPHELNIVFDMEGKDIFLANRQDYLKAKMNTQSRYRQHYYFFPDIGISQLLKFKLMEMKKRYLG